jgi:uncharacterized paraquat-inducible protein A
MTQPGKTFSDHSVHVKFKLAALWTAITFCYVYGDLFGFFRQATVADIVNGNAGYISTQAGLLVSALVISMPCLMPFLCLVMRPKTNRMANLMLGPFYTLVVCATVAHAWMYYLFLSAIEVALSILVVFYAWTWPPSKEAALSEAQDSQSAPF